MTTEPWGVHLQVLIGLVLGWLCGFGICFLIRSNADESWWWWVSGLICMAGIVAGEVAAALCIMRQDRNNL